MSGAENFEGLIGSNELEQDPSGGLAQTGRDLFAGAMGGIAQVLIGQPFDIVKVRLQTTSQYQGALDAALQINKHEGPLAFYKGTLTPLIGIGACVSVQFGGFHAARRYFENSNAKATGKTDLTLGQYYTAGALAGVANTVLSSPIEHVRIRLQTQPHAAVASQRLYPSPWACIKTLSSPACGGITLGLYRGTSITLVREAQAYGCWFLAYEWMVANDVSRRGLKSRSELETWRLGVYGGLAGEALWLGSYPFDIIKSRMQSDGLLPPGSLSSAHSAPSKSVQAIPEERRQMMKERVFTSTRHCIAQTYKEGGILGFYRGIGPTLLRAMPVSGATFVVAEMVGRLINPA